MKPGAAHAAAAPTAAALHVIAQLKWDALLALPVWLGLALLGLAAAVTVLGRHGMRPLCAAIIGGGLFLLAFFVLPRELTALGLAAPAYLPGIAGIIAGVLGLTLGALATRWGPATLMAVLFGAGGALLAPALGLFWPAGAAPLAGLGLFFGMVNHRALAVLAPPLCCAPLAVLGAAICWAPHGRGAVLYPLNDLDWTLAATAALLIALLALALEREHRRKQRLAARTKAMADAELKENLERGRKAFQKANEVQ